MPERKSLEQLSRSGLYTRLWRHRRKIPPLEDKRRQIEVNDCVSIWRGKALRTFSREIENIKEQVAAILNRLERTRKKK
ncbi:hypothetical protein ACFL10_00280 [Patescibacteria group bacterium]